MTNVTDTAAAGGTRPAGRRRAALVIVAILAVLAILLTGGALAYAKQFDGKALPGTTVLGQDVSGRTPEEIAQLVDERGADVTVTVTAGGNSQEVSLADLGVTVDGAATAAAALDGEDGVGAVLASTWSGERAITPVVTVDEAAVATFAKSLVPDDRTVPVDASVAYDEETGTWSVVEGSDGQGVDPTQFVETVTAQAGALEDFSVDQPFEDISPSITTADAQSAVDSVDALLTQDMQITDPDGEILEIDADRRSSWLSVAPDEAGESLVVSVDEDAIRAWVAERVEKRNHDPKNGIEQVDEDGTVVKVVSEKQDGVEVTNGDAVADQIIASLTDATPLETAFESQAVAATVDQIDAPKQTEPTEVTEAGESSDAATATGEKWIDVDLTAKTVTAYVGTTAVFGPRSMVDGKSGYETVTGSYEIYLRYDMQDMTNAGKISEDDPRYYYTEDVPWVQYFYRGYAFHGAPWRSSFGYSGSHGCINMSVSDAKWLYNWASIGTRVEVHY
ncbi:L,D-transpeptidase family protein [Brachybacterium sp. DNPG3]